MESMPDAKRALRAEMRALRRAIEDRPTRVNALCDAVFDQLAATGAHTVMAFVGVGSEPDTSALLRRLHDAGVIVLLPRVDSEQIVAAAHLPGDDLLEGPFGILAPSGPSVDPALIDAVIVPGLAFTAGGRRLGQGGGFYDRYLPLLRDECVVIGVCFAEQIVDDLPSEAHDRVMDVVISA